MRYRTILFPGRHHTFTRFQWTELAAAVRSERLSLSGRPILFEEGTTIVVAITSADHDNTRRNPVPAELRAAQAHLASATAEIDAVRVVTSLVPDTPHTDRFADYVVKQVQADPFAPVDLSTDACVIACSTPAVAADYQQLGYEVLGMELPVDLELADAEAIDALGEAEITYRSIRPWELVEAVVEGAFPPETHPATEEIWTSHGLVERTRQLFADPLVNAEGDLTDSRDYRTYSASFDRGAERKWALLAPHVQPGRVVDIGCATGAILAEAARHPGLHDADLYGIEITRTLIDECRHRRAHGYFDNPNTFFHQRNIAAGPIFEHRSVDTTLTLSLTHELWSYASAEVLDRVSAEIFDHTARGGVWLNYDVAGPDDPGRLVDLTLDDTNGIPASEAAEKLTARPLAPGAEETKQRLDELSTLARFFVFADTFRAEEGDRITFEQVGPATIRLTLAEASEFLAHHTYTDSWFSEMHERFTYRNLADWKRALEAVGFTVDPASHSIRNPWLEEHRFAPVAALTDAETGERVEWPETNVVVVARRP